MSQKQITEKSTSRLRWVYPLLLGLIAATLIKTIATHYVTTEWKSLYNWVLYFCCYFMALHFFTTLEKKSIKHSAARHPSYDWPIPGVQGTLGIGLKTLIFVLSNLLSLLNPVLLAQRLRLMFGMLRVGLRVKGREDEIRHYKTKAIYHLPFNEQWLVYHGGDTPQTSHSWHVLNQRYAYDFVKADATYKRHKGSGFQLGDYQCFGKEVISASDGEVITVVDGEKHSPFVGWFFINPFSMQAAGNHVIIKHEEGEYGFYAHLINGSVPLSVGDKVKAGQLIGRCGFSGSTTEPHLHFHLQDSPSFFDSVGLPVSFERVAVAGAECRKARIQRGSWVENCSGKLKKTRHLNSD